MEDEDELSLLYLYVLPLSRNCVWNSWKLISLSWESELMK